MKGGGVKGGKFVMKHNKFFRILSVGVILAMLVAVIPVSPALAAYDYDIELDPEEGEIGDTIDITGSDWPPSTNMASV